ncbi:MAG: cation transporter [Clostridiales bacterium]|nr:cation transporter [Clostridiales bacterium]
MSNYAKVKRLLWIILLANFGVAFLKVFIGTWIRSASMTADGFHSLTDGSSNIICLIGIQLASRPIDEDHPYGHTKFETLSALFVGGILFGLGGIIIINSLNRFMNPTIPHITAESLLVLLITLFINIGVSYFEYKRGKQWGSQVLISDSKHTRSDIYITIGVLLTLLGIKLGLPPVIDSIVSLIVAGFILYSAYEIFRDNCDILVDKAALDTEQLKKIAMSFEQVKDAHDIRSRGSAQDLHVDMHIMTEPNLSVEESHDLIHQIEDRIQNEMNENIQLIVHLEPYHKNKN